MKIAKGQPAEWWGKSPEQIANMLSGGSDLMAMLSNAYLQLLEENQRLRLQRDVLALNHGNRAPITVVIDSSGEVVDVQWPSNQSGSETLVELPAWRKENEETKDVDQ